MFFWNDDNNDRCVEDTEKHQSKSLDSISQKHLNKKIEHNYHYPFEYFGDETGWKIYIRQVPLGK